MNASYDIVPIWTNVVPLQQLVILINTYYRTNRIKQLPWPTTTPLQARNKAAGATYSVSEMTENKTS